MISNNMLLCHERNYSPDGPCLLNGISLHQVSDFKEQSGIYAVSPRNSFIGNHIVNMENALFVDYQGGLKFWGSEFALNKVCPVSSPMGIFQGNVFHNNVGFGWYTQTAFPVDVQIKESGMVDNWNSCLPFDLDTGRDRSVPVYVRDHVEYFHDFAMGGYDVGDIVFEDAINAFSYKGLYWKTYHRGPNTGPICNRCKFVNNVHALNGPGGSGMVEFKDTEFALKGGREAWVGIPLPWGFEINHHCGHGHEGTGSLCASHYVFTGNSRIVGDWKLNEGSATGSSDSIVMYDGSTYMNTRGSHRVFNDNGCQDGALFGSWTKCQDTGIRIVRIYSPNRGDIIVKNLDEGVEIHVQHQNVPKLQYWAYRYAARCEGLGPTDCASYMWPSGYTFLVRSNQRYVLNVPSYSGAKQDLFTVEYSDLHMPDTHITMRVEGDANLAGPDCQVSSNHNRDFVTPYGPLIPQTGAWWHCKGGWSTKSGMTEYKAEQESFFEYHLNIRGGNITVPSLSVGQQSAFLVLFFNVVACVLRFQL
jgi:hypothetical protein